MRLKIVGSRPSRDMANHTRAWPSWNTRIDEIMPSMAPISTTSSYPAQAAATRLQREPLERIHHRGAVAHDRLPRHDAAEDDGDAAVEQRAGDQRGENAEGQVALRAACIPPRPWRRNRTRCR